MMQLLHNMMTGKDNVTYDFVRVLGILTVLVALGLQVYSVVIKGEVFSAWTFGTGMGAVFATLGAALKIKETTEP